ncbi:hypothetical protein EMCG_02232 [[Emmonsia] crescens]|uniref:Uncharacterized protein n=1 Tax=[Emmonsia] crescens TaxID=73230 RepID=A0A0G2J961_9EURO|nr:hypothetical protein EMCG_02232 [Emmonsia crescens UAMH 3008]
MKCYMGPNPTSLRVSYPTPPPSTPALPCSKQPWASLTHQSLTPQTITRDLNPSYPHSTTSPSNSPPSPAL